MLRSYGVLTHYRHLLDFIKQDTTGEKGHLKKMIAGSLTSIVNFIETNICIYANEALSN